MVIVTMGFADLSIADIAAEHDLPVETGFYLCDRLGVTYKNQQTKFGIDKVSRQLLLELYLNRPSQPLIESGKLGFFRMSMR